jgi:hypothetical protein
MNNSKINNISVAEDLLVLRIELILLKVHLDPTFFHRNL